jgi:transposase
MAFQRTCGSRFASDLCRDAAHEGGVEGADQQDRPQRCARHRANDASGALSSGACEDVTQPENTHAADPSQAAAVEDHRIDNDLRGTLRNFGLKVGVVGKAKFEVRIKELVENHPDLAVLVEPLLVVRRVLREQLGILHRRLLVIVRDDEVCRRLMTVPGVGPVVALTYRATVDVPARFRNSKTVGAALGLTPSKYQSGEINRTGAISRCGDEMMRVMLYEAAHTMLVHSAKWSWLKAWAMKIARHRGMKKAIVALARRLAVIMHRIWVDGTEFRWTRDIATA